MYLNNKTTYASYSFRYPFSILSLSIRLNLFNDVHVFSLLLQLFHNVTPFTVIQLYFMFVLTNCFLNISFPLRL